MTQFIDIIKTVAANDSCAFAIVSVLLFGLCYIYGKFVLLAEKVRVLRESAADTESRTAALCASLDGRIEALRGDFHAVNGDIRYIKNMINSLVNANQTSAAALVQAHSPLALTDTGRKAAGEMSATEAVAANWSHVKSILDAEVPSRNPYDIQTFCLERIPVEPERFFGNDVLDAFKVYAFNHGRTLFDCLKVVGVIVRDKCLADRGIPLASLDEPPKPPNR